MSFTESLHIIVKQEMSICISEESLKLEFALMFKRTGFLRSILYSTVLLLIYGENENFYISFVLYSN